MLRDPGPLSSFVQKNGVFLEQLRLSCMGHLSPGPFIRKKDWNSPAGGRSQGRVCITDHRHTLPDQRGADSSFMQWVSGDGELLEGEEEAFKDDGSHISHSTTESPR